MIFESNYSESNNFYLATNHYNFIDNKGNKTRLISLFEHFLSTIGKQTLKNKSRATVRNRSIFKKQSLEVFHKKRRSYKFCKFHRKTPAPKSFLNKNALFFKGHLRWLLLILMIGLSKLLKKRFWKKNRAFHTALSKIHFSRVTF